MNQPHKNQLQPQTDDDDAEGMIIIQSLDEIPKFTSEDEEHVFWDTHTLASHLFTRRGHRPGSLVAKRAAQRQAEAAAKRQERV